MPDTGNTAHLKLLCAAIVIAYLIVSLIVPTEEAHITGESSITVLSIETAPDNLTLTITTTTGEAYTYDLSSQYGTLSGQGYDCYLTGTCTIDAETPQIGKSYHILYDHNNHILRLSGTEQND